MAWKPFNFFKYNPETDENQTFNISKALNENWDHAKELFKEEREEIENVKAELENFQKKSSRHAYTMTAAGWNQETKAYSFEETYPSNQYDITIEPAKGYTEEQQDAWSAACIKGDIATNIATADGEVPTVDLPIYIEVTEK